MQCVDCSSNIQWKSLLRLGDNRDLQYIRKKGLENISLILQEAEVGAIKDRHHDQTVAQINASNECGLNQSQVKV